MKAVPRALIVTALAISILISILLAVAFARQLGSKEARREIAAALGLDKPDAIRIKNISSGPGGEAVVEAQFELAFRFSQDKKGDWQVVGVRAGDRQWESIELIQTAVRKEKILRTSADLRTLVTAIEAFRRARGFYVTADTGSGLVDNLAPSYMSSVIRLDAWSREFEYKGTAASYRLASKGPDGKSGTADDIVIESGRFVKGADE